MQPCANEAPIYAKTTNDEVDELTTAISSTTISEQPQKSSEHAPALNPPSPKPRHSIREGIYCPDLSDTEASTTPPPSPKKGEPKSPRGRGRGGRGRGRVRGQREEGERDGDWDYRISVGLRSSTEFGRPAISSRTRSHMGHATRADSAFVDSSPDCHVCSDPTEDLLQCGHKVCLPCKEKIRKSLDCLYLCPVCKFRL